MRKGSGGTSSARQREAGTDTMNALTDAEMMAAFGALSADRKELIFTCLQMLLEEQHEDERAWQTGSTQQRPRP